MGETVQPSADAEENDWQRTRLLMRRPWLDDLPDLPPLPVGYALRLCRSADDDALADLLSRAFQEPWDSVLVRQRLTGAPDVPATFMVEGPSGVVATASARLMPDEFPQAGYLHWVAADPSMHGTGLGAQVSRRVLEFFREFGLRTAVLETQTFRLAALRSYLRSGFVPEYRDQDEMRRWADVFPRLFQRT